MLFMGKSTISIAMFNSYVTNYQRLFPIDTIILVGEFPLKSSQLLGNGDFVSPSHQPIIAKPAWIVYSEDLP